MRDIPISELRKISADQLKGGECLRLMADGEEIGLIIVGAISLMRDRIIALASQIDMMRGK